eukprot:TRINITY_DN31820_c0_g1_i1.p1 TRINITY_DN31820_c0_g1~~TRINITY_DN31820_c0_g1_i1.p1  ORF type:complete len:367 (+),score=55.17 TRINITY_DN31820_c0_g1_i1:130-1101(+)
MGMLALVEDIPAMFEGKLDVGKAMRLLFTVVGLSLNLLLQFTILYYVNHFIVGQAVHNTQEHYKRYHAEVFDSEHAFQQDAWATWDGPYMELCNMAVTKMAFTSCVIILWTAKMLGEVRTVERFARDVHNIASLPAGSKSSEMTQEADGEFHIVAMSRTVRTAMWILIIIPKLIIAFILLFIGCRWLIATESFSDLILNALALEFIIAIDELIVETLAPERMRERLDATKMKHTKCVDPSKALEEEKSEMARIYLRSMVYMIVCVAWTYIYMNYLQQVLPDYPHDVAAHCTGWFDQYYDPVCPFGASLETCFPYGSQHGHQKK